MPRRALYGALVGAIILSTSVVVRAQLQVVAESDASAPVSGTYRRFPRAVLPGVGDGADNQVAFVAVTAGGARGTGVFAEDANPVAPGSAIAVKNQPSPTGALYLRLFAPTINAAGRVAFKARLRPY